MFMMIESVKQDNCGKISLFKKYSLYFPGDLLNNRLYVAGEY